MKVFACALLALALLAGANGHERKKIDLGIYDIVNDDGDSCQCVRSAVVSEPEVEVEVEPESLSLDESGSVELVPDVSGSIISSEEIDVDGDVSLEPGCAVEDAEEEYDRKMKKIRKIKMMKKMKMMKKKKAFMYPVWAKNAKVAKKAKLAKKIKLAKKAKLYKKAMVSKKDMKKLMKPMKKMVPASMKKSMLV